MRERKAISALAVAAVGGALVLGGCGGGGGESTGANEGTAPASKVTHQGAMKHENAMEDHGGAMKHENAMKDHGGAMKEG
jgi:hypothetical protein